MIRTERRVILQTMQLGVLLVLLAVVLHLFGVFRPLERRLYDLRARWFQFFTPEATDKLVHLDIDDPALETIGAWPWRREKLAGIVDELRVAGVKVLALDVLFSERQEPRIELSEDGGIRKIDDDMLFARSLERLNHAVVPVFFELRRPRSEVYEGIVAILMEDMEESEQGILEILTKRGIDGEHLKQPEFRSRYIAARRWAMRRRIEQAFDANGGEVSISDLRREILPRTPASVTGSPLLRLLDHEYDKCVSLRTLKSLAIHSKGGHDAAKVDDRLTPILPIALAAHGTGHVNRFEDGDHVVRNIPLLVDQDGVLFAQLGLAAACEAMGVDVNDLQISHEQVVIDKPGGGQVVLPVRPKKVENHPQRVGMFFDLPWFGGHDWQTMYGRAGNPTAGHVPILEVWKVRQFVERIRANNANADRAIVDILDDEYEHQLRFDPARAKAYRSQGISVDDFAERKKWIDELLGELKPWIEQYENWSDDQMGEEDRRVRDQFFAARGALEVVQVENDRLEADLAKQRERLQELFSGKTVIMGWTATSVAADFVLTSMHNDCPGPVVHGVVFNSIMTGHTWQAAGRGYDLLGVILVGMLAVLMVSWFSPVRALLGVVLLGGAWVFVNGFVIFDYGDTLLNVGTPMIAIGMVWLGGTVWKFVAERAERTRITKRFRSYVDPMLVNYVIDHREQARLDGKVDELTVVFTDLVGFTEISEELREKSVGLLNEYMQVMVPVIREHRGYVNKFLGDGIMFFFGAPQENAGHAIDAVASALKMQQLMGPLNDSLKERGLPEITMRIGIASGEMVVGDAGPDDASDYTVLGDTVNVASRLEGANKVTGTQILINDRAAELLDGRFMLQPIGKLRVKGKHESVMTWQPVCGTEEAGEELRSQMQKFEEIVTSYQAGQFEACLKLLGEYIKEYEGRGSLVDFYRGLCEEGLKVGVGQDFDGTVVLVEK